MKVLGTGICVETPSHEHTKSPRQDKIRQEETRQDKTRQQEPDQVGQRPLEIALTQSLNSPQSLSG